MEQPEDRESFIKWQNSPEGKAEQANTDAVKDSINQFMAERADHPSFSNREVFKRIQTMANRGILTGDEALDMADQESEGFFSIYHQRRLGEQFKDFT